VDETPHALVCSLEALDDLDVAVCPFSQELAVLLGDDLRSQFVLRSCSVTWSI
jgi:hypothetical protein